ncbi:MAG: PspC domain-containing protein [Candidatus Pelethousia sp.]|nr:PspC domain-containing protein [Candidatus Pelethousia sp.]
MAKTLYRSESGKMICGVCKGVAEYFDVDVSIVRIVWGVLAFTFIGFVAYLIAAVVLPKQG